MRCRRCGKKVNRATILKDARNNIIMTDDVTIGYECGCFNKWLHFIQKNDPLTKIEMTNWGARIYFSNGEEQAKEMAREFVLNDFVRVEFT